MRSGALRSSGAIARIGGPRTTTSALVRAAAHAGIEVVSKVVSDPLRLSTTDPAQHDTQPTWRYDKAVSHE